LLLLLLQRQAVCFNELANNAVFMQHMRLAVMELPCLLLMQQVGLIVGKPSVGSRDLALAVVPTTSQDGEQVSYVTPACSNLSGTSCAAQHTSAC
jgi:hypothetical protein